MFTGKTPDVTAAQVLAVLVWAAAQAVAFGWVTSEPSKLTLSAAATLIAAAWKLADAHLRHGRAIAAAAASTEKAAALELAGRPPAS